MKYLRKFNEDSVIDHFSFLKDNGFHISKPYPTRYLLNKIEFIRGRNHQVSFEWSEIKDELLTILEFFNVEKIFVDFEDDEVSFAKQINLIDLPNIIDSRKLDQLFFDVG